MKHETARQLLNLMLKHSSEQNNVLQTLSKKESGDEFAKIKAMVGRTMGSMYLDAIHPILSEHPDLTPMELQQPK